MEDLTNLVLTISIVVITVAAAWFAGVAHGIGLITRNQKKRSREIEESLKRYYQS
jgi:hypothetical protein